MTFKYIEWRENILKTWKDSALKTGFKLFFHSTLKKLKLIAVAKALGIYQEKKILTSGS